MQLNIVSESMGLEFKNRLVQSKKNNYSTFLFHVLGLREPTREGEC